MAVNLQAKALLCLNNLIEAMSLEDLGDNDSIFELWKNLGTLSLTSNDSQPAVIEASTSAMRAATQKLCAAKIQSIGINELQQLAEFGAKSPNTNVRTNVVHMLGTIGHSSITTLLQNNEPSEGQVLIARFLLEAACSDVEIRVASEALDKIFDMFSEDYTDKLGGAVNLVSRLKHMQPGFKIKLNMAKQRKLDAATLSMGQMARTNLTRFIKYKEKLAGR